MGVEMLLRHPLETLLQYALVAVIPIGNYLVWNRLRQKNFANVIRIGLLSGLTVGTPLLISAICLIASFTGIQSQDGTCIDHPTTLSCCGAIAAVSLFASLYLMRKLCRSWETQGARNSQLVYSLAGIFLSLCVVGASEGRQTVLKLAERAAMTEDTAQRASALSILHAPLLDSATELKRDIADPRSGGLSGMLLGINPDASKQLYFNMTASPYESIADIDTDTGAGDPVFSHSYDKFLANQVIGDVLSGLSLKRSQLRGAINSSSLTSNLEWTFVLKNKSNNYCEARAEIALPPGAVVSKLTLWQDGKPKDALITSSNAASTAYSTALSENQNPASIRYLSKGRVLLQCYPVTPSKEIKVSVTMVAPLKLDSESQASLALPRLVAGNFSTGISHDLHFLSDANLKLDAVGLHSVTNADKAKLYVGSIKDQEGKNAGLSLIASRPAETGTISSRNLCSGGYTVQTVREIQNKVPKNLVVVIDGSKRIAEFKSDISEMLSKVEKLTATSVLLADSDSTEAPEALSVSAAIKQLNGSAFDGGHDNLPAVVKAAELAGQQNDSAVLWIHGPQPALNEEIYITSQAASKPSFYDLALDDGWTNTRNFLKNHQEIGPMVPIARSGKLSEDLSRFITQWQPGGHHYSVQIENQAQKPEGTEISGQDALDLSILGSAQICKRYIADDNRNAATQVAIAAHIVSPVTAGAVVPTSAVAMTNAEYSHSAAQAVPEDKMASNDSLSGFNNSSVNAQVAENTLATIAVGQGPAMLSSATNGTIAAQGADATVIQGVCTAGTVRVNNLANAEALLNIFANVAEILGIVGGGFTIINSLIKGRTVNKLVYGVSMILLGLATPGVINWLFASARDSALFN